MNKKMLSLGLIGLMASGTGAQAAEGMITFDAGHGGNNSTAETGSKWSVQRMGY